MTYCIQPDTENNRILIVSDHETGEHIADVPASDRTRDAFELIEVSHCCRGEFDGTVIAIERQPGSIIVRTVE